MRNTKNAGERLDALSYHYNPLPSATSGAAPAYGNRLLSVSDPTPAGRSDEDEQPANNYTYDVVGNLSRDQQAGTRLNRTPYGKVETITNALTKRQISFGYDAQGNRAYRENVSPDDEGTSTYYVRDAQGNILAVYEYTVNNTSFVLIEQPIYGTTRLGARQPGLALPRGQQLPAASGYYAHALGQKAYELADHLGNVRAVLTDEKTGGVSSATGTPALGLLQPVVTYYAN